MRLTSVTLLALTALALSRAAGAEGLQPLEATADDSTVYAMGLVHARELRTLNLDEAEFALYVEGLRDGFAGRPKLSLNRWLGSALASERGRRQARIVEERRASEQFLARAAAEPGARELDSGLVFTELAPGHGPSPGPDSIVVLHFHGTVRDGTIVESTSGRDDPLERRMRDASACWQQGLARMRRGGRAKLVCPAELAYGDTPPSPVVVPGAAITYEIELLGIR